jgi:hypothetical protein
MLENTVELERPQMTIWCKRIASWIPKAANALSDYTINAAFPPQE